MCSLEYHLYNNHLFTIVYMLVVCVLHFNLLDLWFGTSETALIVDSTSINLKLIFTLNYSWLNRYFNILVLPIRTFLTTRQFVWCFFFWLTTRTLSPTSLSNRLVHVWMMCVYSGWMVAWLYLGVIALVFVWQRNITFEFPHIIGNRNQSFFFRTAGVHIPINYQKKGDICNRFGCVELRVKQKYVLNRDSIFTLRKVHICFDWYT